jgi:hypothetical protein
MHSQRECRGHLVYIQKLDIVFLSLILVLPHTGAHTARGKTNIIASSELDNFTFSLTLDYAEII